MHVADVRVVGWLPLEDHRSDLSVEARSRIGAVRVIKPENPEDTETAEAYGDIKGGVFWEEREPGSRDFVDSWWLGGVGVVSVGGAGGDGEPPDPTKTETRTISVFGGGPRSAGTTSSVGPSTVRCRASAGPTSSSATRSACTRNDSARATKSGGSRSQPTGVSPSLVKS